LQENNLDRAEEEYLKALAINPDSEQIFYNLGLIEASRKNWEQARNWFSRIKPGSKIYADAQTRIIMLEYDRGNKQDAIEQAKKLIEAHPGKKEPYLILIEIYEKDGNYDGAIETVNQALSHIPQDPDLFYTLAIIYSFQGNIQKYLEFANVALNKKPDDPAILNFIAYTWVEQKTNLDQAEKYLNRALEIDPENGAIIDSMGWLYFQKGDYQEALKWIKRAQEKIPDDPEILLHLGQIYLKLGNRKKSASLLEQALTLKPRPLLKKQIEELMKQAGFKIKIEGGK
jgi:tetratricopeptide (TPR) repeat protein